MGGKVRSIYGLVAASVAATAPAGGQSVQYRSAAGVEYRAQRDTGAIARAESALAADPRSVERIVQLGVAQSGARQCREAIQTFTRGLTIAPNDAVLYRWRGHRYLSVRQFDRALDDLTRGSRLDSTNYGIWYHLGIVRYARGDFAAAADAFARAQRRPPDAAELAGATDWLWMSLSRAGRAAEAQAMLDRRPDSVAATNAYAQRLRLYRGQIGPDDVLTAADTGDIALATLSYGVGNWYLVRGDTARARAWFERSVRAGGRGAGDAGPPPRLRRGDERVCATAAALSRADRPRRRAHGGRYWRYRAGDAELRGGQLVPGAGRHGAGACLVRALGALGRLAGVRIHHVRSRAAAVAVTDHERSPGGVHRGRRVARGTRPRRGDPGGAPGDREQRHPFGRDPRLRCRGAAVPR